MNIKQFILLLSSVVVLAGCSDGGDSSPNAAAATSSSITEPSSSAARSSSSKAGWAYLNPAISYGEFTDDRDGQAYKSVVIGTQTWMAENLNYAVDSSWCYGNSADSCSKYGRLYQWAAAMGVSASYNGAIFGDSVNHRGVCPAGWHVPTSGEWTTLEIAAGGSDSVGPNLKSAGGWYDSGNGTDSYGFSALPADFRNGSGDYFYLAGYSADFWSATEYDVSNAYDRNLGSSMYTYHYKKYNAFSVRCVQD